MVFTPRFFSAAAWALAVSISSLKSTDATRLVREIAPVLRVAPAVLHPQQLSGAFVELVVAHAADVQAQGLQGLHRRLVVEHARQERRPTDEVTRGDGEAVGVSNLGPQRLDRGREVFHAAYRRLGRVPLDGKRRVGRLKVTVVVVERQQLDRHLDRPAGGRTRSCLRRRGGDRHASGEDQSPDTGDARTL